MRKLLLTILVLITFTVVGVKRFDYLATKPMDPQEFSWFNKAEIYTGFLAMMIVGFLIYPEISKEMWYMLFPSSEGKELIFEDDYSLHNLKLAILAKTKQALQTSHPSKYLTTTIYG